MAKDDNQDDASAKNEKKQDQQENKPNEESDEKESQPHDLGIPRSGIFLNRRMYILYATS